MLLVAFHGGSGSSSINNIHIYDTPGGKDLTKEALGAPKHGKLSELRAMVLANGLLYVANGAKSESTVLVYEVPSSGTSFTYAATLIGPTLSKKEHFETAIAHPFGIAFSGATCFISNQDTNVVGQVDVGNGGLTGSLVQGPSNYLKGLFPTGTFLDGTYVASQVGTLPDVKVEATVVDHDHGELAVSFDIGKVKNSVRDVAVANGILLVCDEPDKVINLYSLADGSYLGCKQRARRRANAFCDQQWRALCQRRNDAVLGAATAIRVIGLAQLADDHADAPVSGAQDRRNLVRRRVHRLRALSAGSRRQQPGWLDLQLQRRPANPTCAEQCHAPGVVVERHARIRAVLVGRVVSGEA